MTAYVQRFRLNARVAPLRMNPHNTAENPQFMAERRRRIRSFEWSTAIIASISLAAGIAVYLRDGADKVVAILSKDLELLAGMLPKMAAGCLIAAFVTRLLPREVVARVVGSESGLLGLFVAMMMGAVLRRAHGRGRHGEQHNRNDDHDRVDTEHPHQ